MSKSLNASILFKRILSGILFHSGIVSKRIRYFSQGAFYLILMYHKISPAGKGCQAGMHVHPASFEKHLIYLEKYFNIMPLNVLTEDSGVSGFANNGKPLCFLTFDDGWKDFYENAFPLLKKYGKQATVFLPTDFIGSQKQFWTDCFARLFAHRKKGCWGNVSDPEMLEMLKYFDGNLHSPFEKQLEDGVAYLKKYPLYRIEEFLRALSDIWNVDINENDRFFLTWEEIIEMKNSGLVSFGSHTVNHQILTTIGDKGIRKELVDSRNILLERKVIDLSFIPFCYPNGNYTEKIADLVRTSGYHLAVTTQRGWNDAATGKFVLKRVGIHEDMASTTAQFACRLAGLI